jgi:glycosyltransferase involved in cell wall biosynthesis
MIIHQLMPGFSAGDPISSSAVDLAWLLRRAGHHSVLYAAEPAPGWHALVRPLSELRPAADDLVLLHHAGASSLASRWLLLPGHKGTVFHHRAAQDLGGTARARAASAQLVSLGSLSEVSLAFSGFGAEVLRAAGHRQIHVLPPVVELERFADRALPPLPGALRERGGSLLAASGNPSDPRARLEDVLALHRARLAIQGDAHLALLLEQEAAQDPGARSRAIRRLRRAAAGVRGVHLLPAPDHATRVAILRASRAFVSMSENDTDGRRLFEAMAADVPVVAFGSAGVPELLAGAGVAFSDKDFTFLAELLQVLDDDASLRLRVLRGQARRLEALGPGSAQAVLQAALAPISASSPGEARQPAGRGRTGRKRLAVVVQRFGEVGGGAERHAQWIAERLSREHEVTVLTTCAADHLTWANAFPEGEERVGRLRVLRFPTRGERRMRAFNAHSRNVFGRSQARADEERWLVEQGPDAPGLLTYLSTRSGEHDAFLFFTSLYAPTALGLPLVAQRSLLVPTAHDEPALALRSYDDVFDLPRALLCNTPEEVALIARRFPAHAPARVVGVGVEAPRGAPARFARKYGVHGPYLLYVGRLEPGKGLDVLLRDHRRLRAEFHDAPELLLAGSGPMRIRQEGVRHLGRISDQDKHDGLAGALAAVVPSRLESLSLLTLEAFAQGTPVVVNGESEVLVGQVERSGAGAAYTDPTSFAEAIRTVGKERARMSPLARRYAAGHTWDKVLAAYREELEKLW